MSRLERTLGEVGLVLGSLNRRWALVGGLAVSARVEPRFTRDLDLALSVDGDRDAEALCAHFLRLGYRVLALVEQEAVGRLATARLIPPNESEEGVILDLLFASSGIEPEVVASSSVLSFSEALRVPVACIGHLLALKLLAESPERPQDTMDLQSLLRKATPSDIAVARDAVSLIQQRGFHRNKNLGKDLDALLERFDPF